MSTSRGYSITSLRPLIQLQEDLIDWSITFNMECNTIYNCIQGKRNFGLVIEDVLYCLHASIYKWEILCMLSIDG